MEGGPDAHAASMRVPTSGRLQEISVLRRWPIVRPVTLMADLDSISSLSPARMS